MNTRKTNAIALALLLMAGILAGGCERIAPVRTLPSWVRGIYIPVFQNTSYEPALEENATILTQEAFLSDGRLDVVQKPDADAMLLVTLVDWQQMPRGETSDHVSDRCTVTLTASVKLCEPFDEKAVIADLGRVKAVARFNMDTRSVRYDAEPDRNDELLRQLADMIVFKTLSGFPQTATPLGETNSPSPTHPREIDSTDILRGRKAYSSESH